MTDPVTTAASTASVSGADSELPNGVVDVETEEDNLNGSGDSQHRERDITVKPGFLSSGGSVKPQKVMHAKGLNDFLQWNSEAFDKVKTE